jgi:arsenite-transporting ATPase
VILYTGKGGVGKTSVAAATALMAAKQGLKTVIISTDPAHSVADAFDVPGSSRRTQLRPNLWMHEVDALTELEANWKQVHGYVTNLLASQGIEEILAEELASPPGMGEVAGLMWIRKYVHDQKYDLLVVDCAPTGETLQLLMFPDAARWWLDKIYPWERKAMRIARPVLQPLIDVPLPTDEVYASIKDLLLDLEGMKKILVNPKVTSMRLVLNLEKMVVKEAKRAFTYLSLFGYVTDAVIVNRTLPEGLQDELFRKWQTIHQRYAGEVEQSFKPLPIFDVPLFDEEVVGERMLLRMAEAIYGDGDPAERYYEGSSQRVEKLEGEYVLFLKAPFVDPGEVELGRQDGDLLVTVGNYRREIALPRVLAGRKTVGASIEDGELRVRFAR